MRTLLHCTRVYFLLNPIPFVVSSFINHTLSIFYVLFVLKFYINYFSINDISIIEMRINFNELFSTMTNLNPFNFNFNPNNQDTNLFSENEERDESTDKNIFYWQYNNLNFDFFSNFNPNDRSFVLFHENKKFIYTPNYITSFNFNYNVFNENHPIPVEEKLYLKPYPKTLILPDGKVVSKDGDSLSNSELALRKLLITAHTKANLPIYDYNMRRFEHFFDAYSTIKTFNEGASIILNPSSSLAAIKERGFLVKFDWPITHYQKIVLSTGYASYMECIDIYKELRGEERPHSRFTTLLNTNIPLNKTTFEKNDTWDDSQQAAQIIKNTNEVLKKKINENVAIIQKCDIF